jgi:uncharacterized protein with FMN-binding domain
MRRIVIWAMSTLTALVLLFSYSTSHSSTTVATAETRSVTSTTKESSGSTSGSSGDTTTQEPTDDSASSGDTSSGGGSGDTAATTYDGDAYGTRYGDVQVQITVESGKITDVTVLQVPWNDRHDQMINSQAVPIYNQEAIEAQSADIDVVSGATVTWEGYTQSLQSAIDKANL